MQQLPIGIQDFRKLRTLNNVYVDKTQQLATLIQVGNYHFLSRPRRFGKSLMVSTLAELFKGSRELFEGLWIDAHWDWTAQHPVIHLQFNSAHYHSVGLEQYITDALQAQAKLYGLTVPEGSNAKQLEWLIQALAEMQQSKVVLLVDEYDKPIIDFLADVPKAIANQEIMKRFYSALKPLDALLRFVFITGVSQFSRVSIFSDLNNLHDLTMHRRFSDLVGYTQPEIVQYFKVYLSQLAPEYGGQEALLK